MRRYYNPELSSDDRAALDWANFAQLMVGQSLLGSITPRMVAVDVRTTFERTIDLHVYTEIDTEEDSAEINDALADLDNYLSHLPFPVATSASTEVDPHFVPEPGMRLAYLRARRGPDPSQ